MVVPATPASFDQAVTVLVCLPILSRRVRRVLSACSAGVAQRQLRGLYIPLFRRRSMLMPGGRFPMSAKKFSKLFRQRLQTLIPRPPYRGKSLARGLWQRSLIAFQRLCSGVPDMPCFTNRTGLESPSNVYFARQPQCPHFRARSGRSTFSRPHSQR